MMQKRMLAPADLLDKDKEANGLLILLETGRNMMLTACASHRLACVLARSIDRRTAQGKTTAILADSELRKAQFFDLLGLCEYREGREDNFTPRTYARSGFLDVLDSQARNEDDWFNHLDLVIVPCVEDTLQHPFEWEHLCYRIHDRCVRTGKPLPQFILVISPRDLAEPSLRRNFPIFDLNTAYSMGEHTAHEHAFGGSPVSHVWWTLWAAEDSYLQSIMPAATGTDYGIEPVLAYFAGSKDVRPSLYRPDSAVAMEDQRETLRSHLTSRRGQPLEQYVSICTDGYFGRSDECSAEAVRDLTGNPWRMLRTLVEDGGEAMLASVVVQPGVLRGYLIGNAAYYSKVSLEPLTPRMLNSLYDTLAQMYLRLKRDARIALDEVRKSLLRASPESDAAVRKGDSFTVLKDGFKKFFDATIANRLRLSTNRIWTLQPDGSGSFSRKTWVSLDASRRLEEVGWLTSLRVDIEGGAEAGFIRRDHAWQLHGPGQQCCLGGKLFRGEAIEDDHVRVVKDRSLVTVLTRREIAICMNDPLERKQIEAQAPIRGSRFEFRAEAFELPFRILSAAWWESEDFGDTWRRNDRPQPDRAYLPGRALRIVLSSDNGEPMWTPAQRLALVLWLNEAARTLLPESFPFFVAATSLEESALPQHPPTRGLTPQLQFIGDTDPLDRTAIWIIEDSHADLGIVGVCKDRAEWLLNLCLDYLTWRADEAGTPPDTTLCEINYARIQKDFLAYGEAAVDPACDFTGLRETLSSSGLITARSSRTKSRRQFLARSQVEAAEAGGAGEVIATDEGAAASVICDFCAAGITTQGQRLADGRHRCHACSAVAVDSAAEAQKICDRVLSEFHLVFAREVPVALKIHFASASEIAARAGKNFLPTSAFDVRSIGMACVVDGNDYSIFIEQGHAMPDLSMTIAHELAHIWQYTWTDFARLQAEPDGLLLTEGHASWAEICYARYKAANAANREERNLWEVAADKLAANLNQRSDEYGQGYRRFMQQFGPEGDAFGWLAGQYPKAV